MDEKKAALAVYATLCQALDARQWKYDKDEEKLVVLFGVNGDDIPMRFIIGVDQERQMIRLVSPLSFKMSEGKRIEGAIAACVATCSMADGCFDYDLSDGQIVFRMTAFYHDCQIGQGLFQYMISCACTMVDEYNDQFLAIDKGLLSIPDFISRRG